MASIFTKIVNGEIPCHKVAETEKFLAFLDINPTTKGHTLAIPKQEVDYLFDLDDETLAELMQFSKRVAIALKKSLECKRVGISVIGTEVPHAHVHLIPFNSEREMNIVGTQKLKFTHEQLAEIAASINAIFK